MFDELFNLMAIDGYANWRIHGRFLRLAGNVEVNVPHALSDARFFLQNAIAPLQGLVAPAKHDVRRYDLVIPTGFVQQKTRLQCAVLNIIPLLENVDENSSVGVAVDLYGSTLFSESTRNNIAMPVIEAKKLDELTDLDPKSWRSTLKDLAHRDAEDFGSFFQRFSLLKSGRRLPLYSKLPVNGADVIFSYWGALERHLPQFSAAELESLDFAVTADAGPRQICVLWSVGSRTLARLTTAGESPWSGKTICLEDTNV